MGLGELQLNGIGLGERRRGRGGGTGGRRDGGGEITYTGALGYWCNDLQEWMGG